ncbi:sensor domain-containing diguanylate cyclase [Bacillus shivajii]|uniref:diguanylate cyclase domain-containing protein n=1 Tax=Bacillus shivajii TaxID=1983719 RepID=UPI001CFAF0C5|nr:diguanylate cyclase [Bacillus shivajii]UCZ53593.1 sensor domain-containing diguanylate cyclase [Bacillus shivajii]
MMTFKGRIVASVVMLFIIAQAIHHYLIIGQEYTFRFILLLLVTSVVWWLGHKYDQLLAQNHHFGKEIDEIKEKNDSLTNSNTEYEVIFNSLEGAVFSYDLRRNQIYFSKQVQKIYGLTNEQLMVSPHIWKEMIHPEDVKRIEKEEKRLLSGESIQSEFRVVTSEGDVNWVVKISTPILGSNHELLKVHGELIDVTDRKKLELELKQMAFYDDLTDLPNRKSLDRHIDKALSRSRRHNHNFTIMFVDLDGFKDVNDNLGHDAGDQLLVEVATRLNDSIRDEDLIARIGGDEFVVVFEETCKEEIQAIAERILKTVGNPYDINGEEAKISLSIGVSMFPDDGEDKETLIEHADQAMYYAKNHGKDNYKLYTKELSDAPYKKVGLLERWVNNIQNTKIFGS